MNDWLMKGTAVSRTFKGDINYAEKFHGDGERLLYELKKQMSFNNLGQLRMVRQFTDGTMITVSSYTNSITNVSKDSIHIDVSKSSQQIDCCKKSLNLRNVEAWWQKVPDEGGESVHYAGMTLYRTPSEVLLDDLENYRLYTIPEISGGCVSFTWTVNGAGTIATVFQGISGQYSAPASPGEIGCPTPSITIMDRCGTQKTINITPCCDEDDYEDPIIEYTSLMMEVSEEQTLEVTGGCAPFEWEIISGGGTIVPTAENVPNPPYRKSVYTAPDSNPNCPPVVIQVTDCCGKTDSISIAVTADLGGFAYSVFEWKFDSILDYICVGGGTTPAQRYHVYENRYSCNGNYLGRLCLPPCFPSSQCNTWNGVSCLTFHFIACGIYPTSIPISGDIWRCVVSAVGGQEECSGCPCVLSDGFGNPAAAQPRLVCFSRKSDCPSAYNGFGIAQYNPGYDGEAIDTRTDEMKSQGCCPMNPETGLPF